MDIAVVTACASCEFQFALKDPEPPGWRCPDCAGVTVVDLTAGRELAHQYGIDPGTPAYRVALSATNALLAIAMAKPLLRMGRVLEALHVLEAGA